LEREIGPEYGVLLSLLSEARERIRSAGVHAEGLAWQDVLDSGMLELIRSGETGQAQAKVDRMVDDTLM
jgi:hypothetical protein